MADDDLQQNLSRSVALTWPAWLRTNYTTVSATVVAIPERCEPSDVKLYAPELLAPMLAETPVDPAVAYDVKRELEGLTGHEKAERLLDALIVTFPTRDGLRALYGAYLTCVAAAWDA